MSQIIPDIRDLLSRRDIDFVNSHRVRLEAGGSLDLSKLKYGMKNLSGKWQQGMAITFGISLAALAGYVFYRSRTPPNDKMN